MAAFEIKQKSAFEFSVTLDIFFFFFGGGHVQRPGPVSSPPTLVTKYKRNDTTKLIRSRNRDDATYRTTKKKSKQKQKDSASSSSFSTRSALSTADDLFYYQTRLK